MSAPLRRTRGDLVATAAIAAVSLAAVAGVWATAPIRDAELTPAAEPVAAAPPLTSVPPSLSPAWSRVDAPVPGVHRPVIVDGVILTTAGTTVTAVDQAGQTLWTYERDREICSLGAAWGEAVITYRGEAGCGDVVSVDARSGTYDDTRSAIAPDEVVALSSNDRVGTVGAERVELWRSDLVRTVEYGQVEGRQEPGLQPNPDCSISSALTRTSLLAVTETCREDHGSWLRFQAADPEESRKPEITGEVLLDDAGARLVAVAEDAVAVYLPGDRPELVSFHEDGTELHRRPVAPAPLVDGEALFSPVTADLPHHMTWFDGEQLYLLGPSDLAVRHVLEDAVGTGVAVGDQLLVPTAQGLAVVDWVSGETTSTIPVDRGDHDGAVTLGVAGGTIVEKRGDELVGLT